MEDDQNACGRQGRLDLACRGRNASRSMELQQSIDLLFDVDNGTAVHVFNAKVERSCETDDKEKFSGFLDVKLVRFQSVVACTGTCRK